MLIIATNKEMRV